MSRLRRIPPRLAIIGIVAVYLIADLSFNGPLGHQLALLRPGSQDSIEKARSEGVIARVYFQPIHRSQLERAQMEKRDPGIEALDGLIDDELLRHELQESDDGRKITATPAEVDEALRRFRLKFETPESLAAALKAEGFGGESQLRDRLSQTIRLEKLITARTAAESVVSEQEARDWFGKHAAELATPERLQARQVFLATLDREPAEAKQKLEAALAELAGGKKDFAALVSELSEDDGSKPRGGDLGWLTRDRLPADFILPVFALETGKPSLVHSKLGWHLIEVTARKPATPADFEALKPEILSALEARKRQAAITRLREQLRQKAAGHIEIFGE